MMKLFFFPYAGATSTVFLRFRAVSEVIRQCEMIALDIPGRGQRMTESFCKTMDEAAEDLTKQLIARIDKNENYAIAAHSMGCILAYELMHKLKNSGYALPTHIFFSGRNAPDIPLPEETSIDEIADDTIIDKIMESNDEHAEVYKNRALANLFIPILRADVKLVQNYVHQEKKQKLPVDITYFFCIDDPDVNIEAVKHWKDFISGSFQLYYFQGGHFFIFKNAEPIVEIIAKTILEIEDNVPY